MSNPWISTYSGIHFDLFDPTEDMISIVDIAHATSLNCRFTGHLTEFRSVAQHMVTVSTILEFAKKYPKDNRSCPGPVTDIDIKQGLLHDFTEAYLQDISTPLKALLPDYQRLERKLEIIGFKKFNVPTELSPQVKWADKIALISEAEQFLKDATWAINQDIDYWPIDKSMTPIEAELAYLKRWMIVQ